MPNESSSSKRLDQQRGKGASDFDRSGKKQPTDELRGDFPQQEEESHPTHGERIPP